MNSSSDCLFASGVAAKNRTIGRRLCRAGPDCTI